MHAIIQPANRVAALQCTKSMQERQLMLISSEWRKMSSVTVRLTFVPEKACQKLIICWAFHITHNSLSYKIQKHLMCIELFGKKHLVAERSDEKDQTE